MASLPHNIDAERSLLGSLMVLGGSSHDSIFETLSPDDFYIRKHQLIFEGLQGLYLAESVTDPLMLEAFLARDGKSADVGGREGILALTDGILTGANIQKYADLILDDSRRRKLIHFCEEIALRASTGAAPAGDLIDEAEAAVLELGEEASGSIAENMPTVLKEAFRLFEVWEQGGSGLNTGYSNLHKMTNGFQPGELIVIAGRPSMGKTTLALNFAHNIALREKVPVALFSLEVDRRQVAINILCRSAHVSATKLRQGTLPEQDWNQLMSAAEQLSEAPLYIDDSPTLNLMAIRSRARRLHSRHGIGVIVVDYLQLLEHGGRRHENRQQEISSISRSLKQLARELGVPVVTVSQLSRAVESRESHRPRMSDLRESGAIEQDADLILLLYREEYYKPEKEEAKGKAEVIIAKQRNGPTGSIDLAFIGEQLRFEELSKYEEVF
ncbi:MAG TPA: replicative DNA helicase [Planctomycetes bacterium]|nr:replicative DNA helicase [Planctomycetota bacterium]HIN81119.1 replicative DNA helicase [Planctomycetota bacterium]